MKLHYRQPAAQWVEALPQGNGRLGAMIFGGVAHERIALNEDTLWSGYPSDHIIPGADEYVRRARELVLAGKPLEAEEELRQIQGDYTEGYLPLGDVHLTFPLLKEAQEENYTRSLDLMTGVAETNFSAGGVQYARRSFVSHPHQAMCLRMTASQPVLTLHAVITSQLRHSVTVDGQEIAMAVRCPSVCRPHYYDTSASAVLYDDTPEKQGVSATAVLRLDTDGELSQAEGGLQIKNATWVELRLTCRSNFEGFDRCPGLSAIDHAANARKDADAAAIPFTRLEDAHTQDFTALMFRQEISLGEDKLADLPMNERLVRHASGEADPSLPLVLYQFGRYLLASASREGTRATNLQGIWNEHLQAPWSSNYTVNINTEMNYWPAENCNMPGVHEPLFALMDMISVTGQKVAQSLFRARGAASCHNCDLWGHVTPVGAHRKGSSVYAWWPMSYGWMSAHLFEHFIYTGDMTFLRERALPILRSAVQFYIDAATPDKDGYLTVRPATSPENGYITPEGDEVAVAPSSTMTDDIIREVIGNYLKTLELLGISEPDEADARILLRRLPPRGIGPDGRLLEWDKAYVEREPRHRHVSHLYALFPGHLVTAEDEVYADAIRKSLAVRGDDGTGWSLGWKVNLWARLRDGDHALKLLDNQLRPVSDNVNYNMSNGGGSYISLLCAHPPFQIDGNYAAASGVPRLLLDSAFDTIDLLPALPTSWKNVTARGLRGANGVTVDLVIEDGKLVRLVMESAGTRETRVRLFGREMVLPAGAQVENPKELMA